MGQHNDAACGAHHVNKVGARFNTFGGLNFVFVFSE
jgi:hypothetical protein